MTGDGDISVDDAQLALIAYTNQVAGKETGLTAEQLKAANVNDDEEFSVDDVQNILKYYTETKVAGKKDVTWDTLIGKTKTSEPRPFLMKLKSFFTGDTAEDEN